MNPGEIPSQDKDLNSLIRALNQKNLALGERENELAEKAEELAAQQEELTAAVEALMENNKSLRQTLDQLRDRNHELDQILYRISHDLRAPLSSIKGVLSLLKFEPQSDSIRNYGQHIEIKTHQMENLLQSLRYLSKSILETPVFSIVDLQTLIRQLISECSHFASWGHIKVETDLIIHEIKTDEYLMAIILQSLLSNAYTFRDPMKNGKIYIRTIQNEENIVITVTDDGDGIEVPVQPRIFEMFYRGSVRSSGNGLGLYVAKKAAAQLQGHIQFNTEEGNTCFQVILPSNH